ncbi:hypothetical protein MVEN_02375100 [Mycena venus]|uniref:Uncharacterized protein n=1 Tax=Mycena venus TaxID=2733690 RepID=A0A8H6X2G8_9AGAR|nr:hypothetical protein MVEN_02375100 [Mycena venus]
MIRPLIWPACTLSSKPPDKLPSWVEVAASIVPVTRTITQIKKADVYVSLYGTRLGRRGLYLRISSWRTWHAAIVSDSPVLHFHIHRDRPRFLCVLSAIRMGDGARGFSSPFIGTTLPASTSSR